AAGPLVLCGVAFVIPVAGLNLINLMHANTMNLVTASRSLHWHPATLLFAVANPVLAATSGSAPMQKVLGDVLDLPVLSSELLTALVALPGAVAMWLLLFHRLPSSSNGCLAFCTLLVSVASVAAVWTVSSGASYEARHLATASFAVL